MVFWRMRKRTGDSVVRCRQRSEGCHVPQEDGAVQTGRRHLLPVLRVSQAAHVVLVRAQSGHAVALVRVPNLNCGIARRADHCNRSGALLLSTQG